MASATVGCRVDREHFRLARDTVYSTRVRAIEVDRNNWSWTSITGRRSGAIGGVTSSSLEGDFLGSQKSPESHHHKTLLYSSPD